MRLRIDLTKATARLLIALFAFSCVSRAHPWRHHAKKTQSQVINAPVGSPAALELDPDLKAAQVKLESKGFARTIKIKFGNHRSKKLALTARTAHRGNLIARDIDRDGDLDLIWIGSANPKNAVVLINQGEGNFAEVSDPTTYASELDELFNTGDSSDKRSVKKRRKSSSLTSSHFSDIDLGLEVWFQAPALQNLLFGASDEIVDLLPIPANVRKRGPPSIS